MNNLKAIKREKTSSGSNSKLRTEGLIPAILYGGKDPNQNISIEKKEVKNIINSDTFLTKVLELDIDGKKEKVIPRDVSFHVVSEEPIHIDFMRIVSGKKIILEIPVKFSIKSLINIPGLTRELNSPISLPVESVLTAPISIILSFPGDNPVVSRSKDTRLFPKL